MIFMVRRKRGARGELETTCRTWVEVKLGHFCPMCSIPGTHTRTLTGTHPGRPASPPHGQTPAWHPAGPASTHPSARSPHVCPHLPSASKRRQAPRKAAASRCPSAPLSMVLPPALTLTRRRSLCPGPAAGPGFQGGGSAPGAAPRGSRGEVSLFLGFVPPPPARPIASGPSRFLSGALGHGLWQDGAQPSRRAGAARARSPRFGRAVHRLQMTFKVSNPPKQRQKCGREMQGFREVVEFKGRKKSFLKLVTLLLGL